MAHDLGAAEHAVRLAHRDFGIEPDDAPGRWSLVRIE